MSDGFVAGVDGCKKGWVVVFLALDADGEVIDESWDLLSTFGDVLAHPYEPSVVGLDIPIGLMEEALPGGRACDKEARKQLGPGRGSSVFPPPARGALAANSYQEALALNKASSSHGLGLSRQAFGLFAKLREVDELMTPELQERVKEVHPELCFALMNGGEGLKRSKKGLLGGLQRLTLLEAHFARVREALEWAADTPGLLEDDLLDAYAAAWTARRLFLGQATCVIEQPECDATGLAMGIWG